MVLNIVLGFNLESKMNKLLDNDVINFSYIISLILNLQFDISTLFERLYNTLMKFNTFNTTTV